MSRDPVASCVGKKRFTTFTQAQTTRGRRRVRKRSVYHCVHCNGFHLGDHLAARVKRPRFEDDGL